MKEIAMNNQAYYSNFCVELIIPGIQNMMLQSFNSNYGAIKQTTLVYYSISPLPQNISLLP